MLKLKQLVWEKDSDGYRSNALGYKFLIHTSHNGSYALCVFHGEGSLFPISKEDDETTVEEYKQVAQEYLEATVSTWVTTGGDK